MASEKKTPAAKPLPKPPVHNHNHYYAVDRHTLTVLLLALVAVICYYALTSVLYAPIMAPEVPKEQTTKVRVIVGSEERETTLPRFAPPPRMQ
jgi:hypothetical protein